MREGLFQGALSCPKGRKNIINIIKALNRECEGYYKMPQRSCMGIIRCGKEVIWGIIRCGKEVIWAF